LTAVADPSLPGEYTLDVSIGLPSDFRAAQVVRVDTDGSQFGLYYQLRRELFSPAPTQTQPSWVTGMAWAASGSNGQAVTFLADLNLNRIAEVATPNVSARSVLDVACTADSGDDVLLTWTNMNAYNSITILRNGVVITSQPGTATSFIDPDLDGGTYTYEVKPVPASGANLPAGRCSVVVGYGRIMNVAAHSGADPFAIAIIESIDRVLVADLEGGNAYLYDRDLVPITPNGTIPSPFPTGVTSGVAWNSATDTLLWLEGETAQIQGTTLAGVPIAGTSATLNPLPPRGLGDIDYSEVTGNYVGVDLAQRRTFQFTAAGEIVAGSFCNFPPIGTSSAFNGQGVAVVDDPAQLVVDIPLGPVQSPAGGVDRVKRLLGCSDSGLEYGVLPSTLAGVIAGIAWTPEGSNGLTSEYLVGFDTRAIYEVTLDLSSLGADFRRGDVNIDGIRDISDPTTLLLFLFQGGATLDCLDGADVDDSGSVNVADVIALLNFLFIGGGPPLPSPSTACGEDPTLDSQICVSFPLCP
jgi:hypothetical protein